MTMPVGTVSIHSKHPDPPEIQKKPTPGSIASGQAGKIGKKVGEKGKAKSPDHVAGNVPSSKSQGGGTVPPTIVNLLDPEHPQHFEFGEHLDLVSGGAGSCLDVFKTHVRDTVGVEAYLRALGSMSPEALESAFAQSLAAQGLDPGKAGALAGMAAETGVVLLQDQLAGIALDRLEDAEVVCSVLLDDEGARADLLAAVSMIPDKQAQEAVLRSLGLSPSRASKIVKLLAPWIPQEITDPTEQSAADVEKADGILTKGLQKVVDRAPALGKQLGVWQVGSPYDPVTDFSPLLDATCKDLGLPAFAKQGGSVLSQAVAAHQDGVLRDRAVVALVRSGVPIVLDMIPGKPEYVDDVASVLLSAVPMMSWIDQTQDMSILHAQGVTQSPVATPDEVALVLGIMTYLD